MRTLLVVLLAAAETFVSSRAAAPASLLDEGMRAVHPLWSPTGYRRFTDSFIGSDREYAGGMTVDEAIAIVDQSAATIAGGTEAASPGPSSFTPPPRTIDEITAILSQELPDPGERAALLSEVSSSLRAQ
jgi:hypothetical protein